MEERSYLLFQCLASSDHALFFFSLQMILALAASLQVAERYIDAFGKLAKESTTLLLPANASNPASIVTQALSIFKMLNGQDTAKTPPNLLSKSTTDSKSGSHENHSVNSSLGAPVFSLQDKRRN
ncbi:Band 7 protein [Artemisia annua]|uniref:Band 7 protein n=1 Tax=Artemisia annua TaxID=35608 RepID=A0A2U1N549_ARTAN|nr:Band 7 protein [Artemisia annua]